MQVAKLSEKDKLVLIILSILTLCVSIMAFLFKFPSIAKAIAEVFGMLLLGLIALCIVILVIGLTAKVLWVLFKQMWGTKEYSFSWEQRGARFLFVAIVWFGVASSLIAIGSPWWLAWLVPLAMFYMVGFFLLKLEEENNKHNALQVETEG